MAFVQSLLACCVGDPLERKVQLEGEETVSSPRTSNWPLEFQRTQPVEPTAMTQVQRSWLISNFILSISAGMTFYGAFWRHDSLWATCFNATFLILVLLFQLWVSRRIIKRPKEVSARDLATGFKPHPNYPHGIDMTDIKRELAKDPPCRNADHNH